MPRPARTTRVATARNLQSRQAAMREMISVEQRGMLWWDDSRRPAGVTYGWIRRAVRNEEDSLNIRERQMQGWMPVPPDRHPELGVTAWGLPSEIQKNYIEVGGLILCQCPTRDFNRRKDLQDMMAHESVKMKHIEPDPGARDLPVFRDKETGTTFEQVVTKGDPRFRPRDEEEFQD